MYLVLHKLDKLQKLMSEKGESNVVIVNSDGTKTSQISTSWIKFNC